MTCHRRHDTSDGKREAVYSGCDTYRYSLTVTWDTGARRLLYVMLNPSKATELTNDPTIERCECRARQLGYGAFRVVNLFALRETSPTRLKAAKAPNGPDNAQHLSDAVGWTQDILAAWGVHGAHQGRNVGALTLLRNGGKPLFHLGLTKHGHPRHPLYISYETQPTRWD